MTKKLAIVVIQVEDFVDGRKAMNNIENMTFKKREDVGKEILKHTQLEDDAAGEVSLYPISEFMDMCNAQEIDLESVWIGYVYITDKFFR